jgi:hypothetical protein
MAINPFEVASRYGYNADTFATDTNFQNYWSNKTEAQLLQGLQARGDWYAGRMNLQVPTNTGNINTNNLTNQTISGGTSFDNNTIANMFGSGQIDAYNAAMMLQQNRENALQQQMQSQQQQYDQANMNLDQWLGRDVYQELLAERNRQGYDEKLQLLNDYNSQLRDLTLDYQMGRQTIRRESRLESMTKGRNANIYEQYANEATLINNNIAGVQGQLDRIEKNTDKFFEFYSQQRQDMIDNYTSLRNMANQNIIDLSKEEREDIDRRIDIMNTEVQRQDEQRNAKMEILMAAYEKGVDPSKFGVSLSDDFETMMNKLGPAVAAQYQKELEMSNSRSSSSSSGATSYPTNAKSPLQKLAYDTAENIVGLEGSGFSGEDWNTQVNNFIARAGEMGLSLSWQQASDTLAQGMTQYKGANNMAQLNTSNPASDINQDGNLVNQVFGEQKKVEGVSEYTSKPSIWESISGTMTSMKKAELQRAERKYNKSKEIADKLRADIQYLQSKGENITQDEKKALKKAKSRLVKAEQDENIDKSYLDNTIAAYSKSSKKL